MKAIKKSTFLFILIAISIVYSAIAPPDVTSFQKPPKDIAVLGEETFSLFAIRLELDREFNRFWGFNPVEKKAEDEAQKAVVKVTNDRDKNILCIEKSCYRLIGIFQTEGEKMITLFNSELKKKLNSYTTDDVIEANITIKSIADTLVEFEDISDEERKWHFKIFDINQTKYKVKEIEQ